MSLPIPYGNFIDPTANRLKSLHGGKIWYGNADTDPLVTYHNIKIKYRDEHGTMIEVQQPINLNGAGVPILSDGTVYDPIITSVVGNTVPGTRVAITMQDYRGSIIYSASRADSNAYDGGSTNLLSNSGFYIGNMLTETPSNRVANDQVAAGWFSESDLINATYANGIINATSGAIYQDVPITGKLEFISQFTSSYAMSDGATFSDYITFTKVGDVYRVRVDLGSSSGVFSAKFEVGTEATRHVLSSEKMKTFPSIASVSGVNFGDLIAVDDYYGGGNPNNSGVLFFKVSRLGAGVHDGGKYIDFDKFQLSQILPAPHCPLKWGAIMDGTTDDTDEFNKTAVYAASKGESVCVNRGMYVTELADAVGVQVVGSGNFTHRLPNNTSSNSVAASGEIPTLNYSPEDIAQCKSILLKYNANQYFILNTLSSGASVQHTMANNSVATIDSLGGTETTFRHIQSRALTYLATGRVVPTTTSGAWTSQSIPSGTSGIGGYTGGNILFARESSEAGAYLNYSMNAANIQMTFFVGASQGEAEVLVKGNVIATLDLSSAIDQLRDFAISLQSLSTVQIRVKSGSVRFCGFNITKFSDYTNQQYDTVFYHRDTNLYDDWLNSASANDFVIREKTSNKFGCSYHGGQNILIDKQYVDSKEVTLNVGDSAIGVVSTSSVSNVDWSVDTAGAGNVDVRTDVKFGSRGLQIDSYVSSVKGIRCRHVITALAGIAPEFDRVLYPIVKDIDDLAPLEGEFDLGLTNRVTLANDKNQTATVYVTTYRNSVNRHGGAWLWNRDVYNKIYDAYIYDGDQLINDISARIIISIA